jgi:hypothetical protein
VDEGLAIKGSSLVTEFRITSGAGSESYRIARNRIEPARRQSLFTASAYRFGIAANHADLRVYGLLIIDIRAGSPMNLEPTLGVIEKEGS